MTIIILNLLAVIAMIIITTRKKIDRSVVSNARSGFLFWMGLMLLTLYGAIWLVFGIGEISSGDLSGISHLVPAMLIYILVYLTWRRPLEGGIILLITAIISGIREFPALLSGSGGSWSLIIIGVLPPLLAGLVLIISWWIARSSVKTQENDLSAQE